MPVGPSVRTHMTTARRFLSVAVLVAAAATAKLHGQMDGPRVTAVEWADGIFSMAWTNTGSNAVMVERRTSLVAGSWVALEAFNTASAHTDTNAPSGAAFYRLRMEGMSLIPAGNFAMGDAFAEGSAGELPVHTVNVSAFRMDKFEVTKALWDHVAAWAATNGYDIAPSNANAKAVNHPAGDVSWEAAVKWCNARSEMEGLTPCYTVGGAMGTTVMRTGTAEPACNFAAGGYRLPTEAEWEKAARGGLIGRRFPWGDVITHGEANYFSSTTWSYDVSPTEQWHPSFAAGGYPYTGPVASFAPNDYGLHDMAGNVWEWCWDWYSASYYASSPASDPRGPASGALRVYRGGGWSYAAPYCRTAIRYDGDPATLNFSRVGFRTVRSAHPEDMVLIPAGSFSMGDAFAESQSADDVPVHTVSLSAFYLDKYELRKGLWDEVASWAAANGYDIGVPDAGGKAASHPAYDVTWYEAVKWCNARSEREGLAPCYTVGGAVMRTGTSEPACDFAVNGYRLPTEAEWERAARGGLAGKRFPWGDTITHVEANYYSDGTTAYDLNPSTGPHPTYGTLPTPYTAPVGSFAANAYGVHDMAGNVWEWCWDWFSSSYYASSPSANPQGPASGSHRAVRGGTWYIDADWSRVARRKAGAPYYGYDTFMGLRSARSIP